MKVALFFIGLLLAVIGGRKLKVNAGIAAVVLGMVFAVFVCDLGPRDFFKFLPTHVFYNMVICTFFYGFAAENGTMEILTQKLMYAFRNARWLMPLAFFLISAILGVLGADADSVLFSLSPIGFNVAIAMGFNPVMIPLGLWAGMCGFGWMPWSAYHQMYAGWFGETFGEQAGIDGIMGLCVWAAIELTVFTIIIYFVTKSHKVKNADVKIEKGQEFTPQQKVTLWTIILVIVLAILPAILDGFIAAPWTAWLYDKLSIQLLVSVGAIVMIITRSANSQKVLMERVPWGMTMMVVGIGTYMGLAQPMGVIDAFEGLLTSGTLSPSLVVAAMCLVCAVLSFFVSGAVITPLFLAVGPALMGTGASGAAIITSAQMGMQASSLSPFSAGGAAAISGCPDHLKDKVASQQIVLAIVNAVITVLLALFGAYNIIF